MTRQEFIGQLTRCGIDPNIVFFEPRVADGFGIRLRPDAAAFFDGFF